jgi:hypothetical protein
VFATAATNDTVVPGNQLTRFRRGRAGIDAKVVPGAAAGSALAVPWMHSSVRRDVITTRLVALERWLGDRAPPGGATATATASSGADCDTVPRAAWRLLLAGAAWRPAATADQPLAATRGCSGTTRWQDDGLSLWAMPTAGRVQPGAEATLTLRSGRPLRQLSVAFRGFLARPAEWTLELTASPGTAGATRVAACDRGRCDGLRLAARAGGALIAAADSHGDPDAQAAPQSTRFALPSGTRVLTWRLRCTAAAGCGLPAANPARARDPLGHPAIFSMYRVRLV